MKFIKMHGTGNDYIYMDCFKEKVEHPEVLAVKLSNRHKGIGSDGLVLIQPSDFCDFKMRMFNADGSEAQMCGNASRCVGKYVYDSGLTTKTSLTLETKAGIKRLQLYTQGGKVMSVKVDMGEPEVQSVNHRVNFSPEEFAITCISMGNPHAVLFMSSIDDLLLSDIGKRIEYHPMFPERTNVEFIEILSPEEARMRVWERGSGETQACGTGACAALVAGVINGLLDRKAVIHLLGGDLEVEWSREDNRVYLTGDAVRVFEGEWVDEN